MANHDRLIRMGEDLLNDSQFICKSQYLSLSNIFKILDIEKYQEIWLQHQILIINKSTFLANIHKMLHSGDDSGGISMQHESDMQ